MDRKVITTNRKAFHDYTIVEQYEAGLALSGYEVKSLRAGEANLVDGYVRFDNGRMYLENIHIAPYRMQSTHVIEYEPRRPRILLMHKNEMHRLFSRTREKGFTLVPLEIYFSPKGIAKVTLGLAKGKVSFNKREVLRARDIKREQEREMNRRK